MSCHAQDRPHKKEWSSPRCQSCWAWESLKYTHGHMVLWLPKVPIVLWGLNRHMNQLLEDKVHCRLESAANTVLINYELSQRNLTWRPPSSYSPLMHVLPRRQRSVVCSGSETEEALCFGMGPALCECLRNSAWTGSLASLLALSSGYLQNKAEVAQRGHRCPVIRLCCYIRPLAICGPIGSY